MAPPDKPMGSGILGKVTYHAVYDESITAALAYARANGFAGVQVAVETPHLAFERLSGEECSQVAAFRAENGLSVSLHAPDEVCSLFASSRYLAEGIFNYYEALFRFAEMIGSRLITFHPGRAPRFRTDAEPPQLHPEKDLRRHRRVLAENLRRLVDLGDGRFLLCVENYLMTPLVLEIVQPFLDSAELTLCWDLAKTFDAQLNPRRDVERYFWENLDHVRQVHLHDVREGIGHRVIGSGGIDFALFLPRLAEANVREYCIEVRPREKAAESLANLKSLVASLRSCVAEPGNESV